MARYPCGVCDKNAGTSAILCTGSCGKWHHFKCVQLTLSDIKHMKEGDLVRNWKCSKCTLDIEDNENVLLSEGICVNDKESHREEQFNRSTLFEELNKSILNENEELKHELHLAKNNSSLYVLELEDKLKEFEENFESREKLFYESEKDMQLKIKFLEQQLKLEKEARENIIVQVEEESRDSFTQSHIQNKNCDSCVIYKEETRNMLDTIRSLENVAKLLENECLEKQKQINKLETAKPLCLKCFPPLKIKNNKFQTLPTTDTWQKVTTTSRRKKINIKSSDMTGVSPSFVAENKFQVLQDESEDVGSDVTVSVCEEEESNSTQPIIEKKKKILICADSHGKDLAWYVNTAQHTHEAVGFIRPGGLTEQIINERNIMEENLKKEDVLVIVCGSNDVARNESEKVIETVINILPKVKNTNVMLVDLPMRHDLTHWSCVNNEVRRTNKRLEELSENYHNVSVVKASRALRLLHTKHGQHLNQQGKIWLANLIAKTIASSTSVARKCLRGAEDQPPPPGTESPPPGTESPPPGTESPPPGTESPPPGTESSSTGTESPLENYTPPGQPSYVHRHQQLLMDP